MRLLTGLLLLCACGSSSQNNGADAGSNDSNDASSADGADAGDPCADVPTQPTVIATFPDQSTFIVAVGKDIYFGRDFTDTKTNKLAGEIRRVPRGGGAFDVIDQGHYINGAIVSDGTELFFMQGTDSQTHPTMLAVPLGGGNLRPVYPPGGANRVYWPATNGSRGVFFEFEEIGNYSGVARNQGQPVQVIPARPFAITPFLVDATHIYYEELGGANWSSPADLFSANLDGSGVQKLLTMGVCENLLGQDDAAIYTRCNIANSPAPFRRVPKAGGPATNLYVDIVGNSATPFVFGGYIYFSQDSFGHQGRIQRIPTNNVGTAQMVFDDPNPKSLALDITADACGVYWTTAFPSQVYAMRIK